MNLKDFPRPPNDTGIGIHLSANMNLLEAVENRRKWVIREMKAMGMAWAKILCDPGWAWNKPKQDVRSSMERPLVLTRELLENGIMPVIRFYQQQPWVMKDAAKLAIDYFVQLYALFGYKPYIEFMNEPNLTCEWNDEWHKAHKWSEWPEEATRLTIANAHICLSLGALPGFPAVAPGNDQSPGAWTMMQYMKDAGETALFQRGMWVAIHNYHLGYPLNHPDDDIEQKGIPLKPEEYNAWEWDNMPIEVVNAQRAKDKNPGKTVWDLDLGFRGYEKTHMVLEGIFGKEIADNVPILTTEGGSVVEWWPDHRYPKVTPKIQMEHTVEAFRFMMEKAPNYYFAEMPWLFGNKWLGHYNDVWEPHAWFSPWHKADFPDWVVMEGGVPHLKVVEAVRAMPKTVRIWKEEPMSTLPELPEGQIHALDVSEYSGSILGGQWGQAYDAGIRMVIVQAWGGTPRGLGKNRLCWSQLETARKAGMMTAIYLVVPSDTTTLTHSLIQAGRDAAGSELQYIKFFALDIEGDKPLHPTDAVARLRDAIVNASPMPIVIYSSRSKWQIVMGDVDDFNQCILWDARYDESPEIDKNWVPYGGWKERAIKQYGGTRIVAGNISADVNVVHLGRLFGTPEPEPPEEDWKAKYEDVAKEAELYGLTLMAIAELARKALE
jgi:hypothetical protein